MRLKWKNGCAGTGVTLPIFARGTWMKKPNQRPKGLRLDKLETLNIFGVRASYVAAFGII